MSVLLCSLPKLGLHWKIKNLAPLRSSDRRKVVDQIIAEYQIEVPQSTTEEQNEVQAQAGGIGALRNSLLPDGALSAKFSTTVGQDLKTVNGTVYVGAHVAGDQRVLWIKLQEHIVPTGISNIYSSPQESQV